MNLGDAIYKSSAYGGIEVRIQRLESAAVEHLKKCEHPRDEMESPVGWDDFAWCGVCGSVWTGGQWTRPTYNVVTKEKE